MTAVQFAPQLVLAPLSGRLADYGRPGPQIAAGRFLVSIGAGGMAWALSASGGVEGLQGPVSLLMSALIVGLGMALDGPAMQSVIPSLVRVLRHDWWLRVKVDLAMIGES